MGLSMIDDGLFFQMPSNWLKYDKVFPYPNIKAVHRMDWIIKQEIIDWLSDNHIIVDFIHFENTKIHLIHFKNKQDAMRFRLTWG